MEEGGRSLEGGREPGTRGAHLWEAGVEGLAGGTLEAWGSWRVVLRRWKVLLRRWRILLMWWRVQLRVRRVLLRIFWELRVGLGGGLRVVALGWLEVGGPLGGRLGLGGPLGCRHLGAT